MSAGQGFCNCGRGFLRRPNSWYCASCLVEQHSRGAMEGYPDLLAEWDEDKRISDEEKARAGEQR